MNSALSGSLRSNLPKRRLLSSILYLRRCVNKFLFVAMHLAVIGVFFVPMTWTSIGLCVGLYIVRMFGITAGYHRYFAHRAYKTSRLFQFALAWLGCSALQRGPLWWAANHRNHHRYSDTEEDPHSPLRHGFFWSHVGWVLYQPNDPKLMDEIKDFTKYPEIRWLEQLHWIPGLCLAAACFLIDGWSGVFWGFFASTVILYHGVFLVNSICHVFGKRRFNTPDGSRNNAIVAILTLGEGWHNNHHHFMSSANQGFRWWEVDMSYYTLRLLNVFHLVWDLRKVPIEKLHPAPSPATAELANL